MRHLPSVGALPTTPATTPYLVIKHDDNGATFVITAVEAPGIADDAVTHIRVAPRSIGAWTHPTADDIPPVDIEFGVPHPEIPKREPAF